MPSCMTGCKPEDDATKTGTSENNEWMNELGSEWVNTEVQKKDTSTCAG